MPIHYEQDAEHVVLITIDRPEARNAADMDHFKALREAWERFAADVVLLEKDLGVPVRFVGVGERVGDLLPFDPAAFVGALFG